MYNVIAIDFDGVLCIDREEPHVENINAVIRLFNTKENFIVIHTSRNHSMYGELVQWLELHGVPYDAIRMNKMKANVYIDDRNGTL